MKKLSFLIAITVLVWSMQACNNPRNEDSVSMAERANEDYDTTSLVNSPFGMDELAEYDDADFAVKAADGGLLEVELGKIALKNASSQGVKDFGQMMIDDHSKVNDQLKSLAAEKNIVLPPTPGQKNVDHIQDLNKKMGNDFDKAYIDMMVDDHNNDIDLFEKASNRAEDGDIKSFATNTLPTLRNHLAAAKTLQDSLQMK